MVNAWDATTIGRGALDALKYIGMTIIVKEKWGNGECAHQALFQEIFSIDLPWVNGILISQSKFS